MFTVISYDIVEDKRRMQVFKLLKGYGTHVQYSVFECYLSTGQLASIGRELRAIINLDTDSVRCYVLDTIAVQHIQIIGIGRVSSDEPYYLVGKGR
jgi:CRISPR-associated protein Cas2